MPAIALPFLVIWNSSAADLQAQINAEQDEPVKKYLECLLVYRKTLPENNPHYSTHELDEPMKKILMSLSELQNESNASELNAAINNLKGLILRGSGEYAEAKQCFELSLSQNISQLTKAVLNIQILSLFQDQEKYNKQHNDTYADILEAIDKSNLTVEQRKIIASINATVAYGYRKSGNPDVSEKLYLQALELWPDNLVLANNLAIGLSKINSEAALTKAAAVFERFFEDSARNFRFVNPYYYADVNIKLAAIKKETNPKDFHLNQASICLEAAAVAIKNNKSYQEQYKVKAESRMENLRCNLAFLVSDFDDAKTHQDKALELRDKVEEAPEKKEKAKKKFLDLNKRDNIHDSARFFRANPGDVIVIGMDDFKLSTPRLVR